MDNLEVKPANKVSLKQYMFLKQRLYEVERKQAEQLAAIQAQINAQAKVIARANEVIKAAEQTLAKVALLRAEHGATL